MLPSGSGPRKKTECSSSGKTGARADRAFSGEKRTWTVTPSRRTLLPEKKFKKNKGLKPRFRAEVVAELCIGEEKKGGENRTSTDVQHSRKPAVGAHPAAQLVYYQPACSLNHRGVPD